ncbi:MAG TPA: hypothetical protein VFZ65_14045 [Planctomycetota bacterium]|nr:hypothetical protein [Planctomycetota bacterium]
MFVDCLLTVAAGLLPQSPGSGTTVAITGRVLDAAGAPAAEAVVHLFGDAPFGGDATDEHVQAKTGQDGTFAVDVRADRAHSGWAGTATAASDVFELTRGASTLALQIAPAADCTLAVNGLEAWRDEGPLRARLVVPAHARCAVDWPLRSQATPLPALPRGDLLLELRTSADEVLTVLPVQRAGQGATIALAAPFVLSVLVLDDAEKPQPGVPVLHAAARRPRARHDPFAAEFAQYWRRVGTSDDHGRLRVRLPLAGDPFRDDERHPIECLLAADRDGCARGLTGWYEGMRVGASTGGDEQLEIVLPPAEPFEVTLLQQGKPLAGERVRLLARATDIQSEGMSFRFGTVPHVFEAVTDADGTASFARLPADASEFRLERGATRSPTCFALPTNRRAAPRIDLDDAGELRIELRDAGGKPGGQGRGVAMPVVANEKLLCAFGCEPRFETDASGAATLALAAGRWWIFADNGAAFAHAMVSVDRGGTAVALQWHAYATNVWRVATTDGTPADSAAFDAYGQQWIDGTAIPSDLLARQFLGVMDARLAQRTIADPDGRLCVRFVPPEVMTTFGRVRWAGRESVEMHLRPGRERSITVR